MARPAGGAVPFCEWAGKWFAARVVRVTTQADDVGRSPDSPAGGVRRRRADGFDAAADQTFGAQMSAKRKPATVRHAHALLSTIVNDAVAEGLLLTNPCRFSRPPREARYEAVGLFPAEVERLVDAINPAYHDLVVTAVGPACAGASWPV